MKLTSTAERTGEIEIVEQLIEAAEKRVQATIGLHQPLPPCKRAGSISLFMLKGGPERQPVLKLFESDDKWRT